MGCKEFVNPASAPPRLVAEPIRHTLKIENSSLILVIPRISILEKRPPQYHTQFLPHLFLISGSAPCLMRYRTIGRCPFDEAFTVEVDRIREVPEKSYAAHLEVSIRLCWGH
jgi:hypothetical protein